MHSSSHNDFTWKEMVLPILEAYTESTDGSYIEAKESAIVWHYKETDPDFGRWQAKELLDHLEGMLSNEPVEVSSGQAIVEVKPQHVSKGNAVDRILEHLSHQSQAPDFVLCIGDDRSDEDMFTAMEHVTFSPHLPAEVFACTVGQKPSKAPFYMNDTTEVLSLLSRLADMNSQHGLSMDKQATAPPSRLKRTSGTPPLGAPPRHPPTGMASSVSPPSRATGFATSSSPDTAASRASH